MKYTISILVENHAGVLSGISGLFARGVFNMYSLAVGCTNDPAVSRMTIVVDGNEYIVEQVEKQLNKLIDVIRLRRLEEGEKVSRELVLIKVECTPKTRSDIIDVVRVMDAKVSDLSKTTLTAELSAQSEKIELFCELLDPYHILEIARTGTIALDKGNATLNA